MSPVSERAAQVRFRRALSLMAMTLIAPGSAQLVAGNRRIGTVAFRIWLGLLAVGLATVVALVADRGLALTLAFNTSLLLLVKLVLFALAIGWAALFVDAWRIGAPLSYGLRHRRASVAVNGLLCFGVAGTLLFGAHLVGVQRDLTLALSGSGGSSSAHDGRINVLLMGGDSGDGRWGLRPDSMNIASIDVETGRTVLVALPRNMAQFPFKEGSVMAEQFPQGFDCDGCYLNGVSTWAQDHTDLFPDSDNPGVDATIMGIEGITGLSINYWAMVNLQGFKDLVNAVGGVTLTVRQPIPVGGLGSDVTGYIDPGTRKLDGFETLWYARAREGSDDYSRMARQKCVMSAMLSQVSPQKVVTNFASLAKASAAMISTNIPAGDFDTLAELALKARGQKISPLSLVPPMINTGDPDIDLVQSKVAEAIDRAEGNAPAAPAPSTKKAKKKQAPSTGDAVTGGSIGSLSEGYAANQADDLSASC
ncbi:MAG: LCP family protein [Actinobacteria bacterium]|nr:LCP family protein [Actinomycetota bacterium]